jgi:hypothetical protein
MTVHDSKSGVAGFWARDPLVQNQADAPLGGGPSDDKSVVNERAWSTTMTANFGRRSARNPSNVVKLASNDLDRGRGIACYLV